MEKPPVVRLGRLVIALNTSASIVCVIRIQFSPSYLLRCTGPESTWWPPREGYPHLPLLTNSSRIKIGICLFIYLFIYKQLFHLGMVITVSGFYSVSPSWSVKAIDVSQGSSTLSRAFMEGHLAEHSKDNMQQWLMESSKMGKPVNKPKAVRTSKRQ